MKIISSIFTVADTHLRRKGCLLWPNGNGPLSTITGDVVTRHAVMRNC